MQAGRTQQDDESRSLLWASRCWELKGDLGTWGPGGCEGNSFGSGVLGGSPQSTSHSRRVHCWASLAQREQGCLKPQDLRGEQDPRNDQAKLHRTVNRSTAKALLDNRQHNTAISSLLLVSSLKETADIYLLTFEGIYTDEYLLLPNWSAEDTVRNGLFCNRTQYLDAATFPAAAWYSQLGLDRPPRPSLFDVRHPPIWLVLGYVMGAISGARSCRFHVNHHYGFVQGCHREVFLQGSKGRSSHQLIGEFCVLTYKSSSSH